MGELAMHCWTGYRDWLEEQCGLVGAYDAAEKAGRLTLKDGCPVIWSATCLLEAGHEGEHERTDDNSFTVNVRP